MSVDTRDSSAHSRRDLLAAAGIGLAVVTLSAPKEAEAEEPKISATTGSLKNGENVDIKTLFPKEQPSLNDADTDETKSSSTAHSLQRPPEEQSRLEASFDRLLKFIGVAEDRSNLESAISSFLSLDAGFRFRSEPDDDDFVPAHVEPLLDQAADLLDRALRDRATWDELSAKMFTLYLELTEFIELDKIHQREESAGIYDVATKRSKAERRAEATSAIYENMLVNHIESVFNRLANDQSSILTNAQLAGWLQGLVPYSYKNQFFAGYALHTFDGVTKTVADHNLEAARVQATQHIVSMASSLISQHLGHKMAELESKEKTSGHTAQYEWDSANAGFLKQRTIVARSSQDHKLFAATTADGVLNYAKRLPPLRKRYQADLREAIARLNKAREGLKTIYGYDIDLPDGSQETSYYDDCLIWCRTAIQWLIRFSRKEQSVAMPLSIRSIVGEKNWCAGAAKGHWTFELPAAHFADLRHVRLRGISAYVVHGQGRMTRLWQILIQIPRTGLFVHRDDSAIKADQSMLPECLLGRVAERNNVRDPDVVGLASVHNASPIGQWDVRIVSALPPLTHGNCEEKPSSELWDIQLDMQLVFRRMNRR